MLVKKFPAFLHEGSLPLFTRTTYSLLSSDRCIHPAFFCHFFKTHFNIIIIYMPKSPRFFPVFLSKQCMHFSSLSHILHSLPISFFLIELLIMQFSQSYCCSSLLCPIIPFSILLSPRVFVSPSM
jgi:hypothetical protein